jgi:hypothetical protein
MYKYRLVKVESKGRKEGRGVRVKWTVWGGVP